MRRIRIEKGESQAQTRDDDTVQFKKQRKYALLN